MELEENNEIVKQAEVIETEPEPEESGVRQDSIKSVVEDEQDKNMEHVDSVTTEEQKTEPESEIEDLNEDLDAKRESALQEMDMKHTWLSALEENYINLETAFISKFQFVAVSNHCQKYLEELSSDESMIQFRVEFSNLFEKFQKAFAGSLRLMNKISETKGYKNLTDAENRNLKIKLEQKDRRIEEMMVNVKNLENELVKTEREKISLQIMFNELSSKKSDNNLVLDQAAQSKPVIQDDGEAEAKIRDLEEQIELINQELEFVKQRASKYQIKMQQAENSNESLQNKLKSVKLELQKQTTRAEKAETTIEDMDTQLSTKNDAIKSLTDDTMLLKSELESSRSDSRRLLKDFRKCQKELDGTAQVIEKLRRDLDVRDDKYKVLLSQKESLAIELTTKQMEVYSLKSDISNVTKERNSFSRRAGVLEEKCSEVESKLESAKKEKSAQQKELDLIGKELEESDNKSRELTKQKDALTGEVLKHEQTITDLLNDIKTEQEKYQILEKELDKIKLSSDKLKDDIKRLEKIKERLSKEVLESNQTIFELRSEVKRLEMQVSDMNKTEAKVRQQLHEEQARYKLLADDTRHLKKLLAESKQEVENFCEQQTMLKRLNEQLQNRNQDLDDNCKKLDLKVKATVEQLGNAKESLKQETKNNEELNAKLKRKDDQEQLILKLMSEKENEIFNLKRKTRNLIEERNVQNSKIIEKDRQIRDLTETIRLLQQEIITLDKSINERINDIKLLKIQISQMNRRNAIMYEQVECMDVTRIELAETQNELLDEKLKSKALEGEVQRPVNLHRWRILEGIDPDRAQLISKNQAMQKQLTKKMAELDVKQMELKEKERIAQELKEQIRRRSEDDAQEQLWICKKELSARMERLKCLTAENTMFQNLCAKYENEIMAMRDQIRKYKVAEHRRRQSSINIKNRRY